MAAQSSILSSISCAHYNSNARSSKKRIHDHVIANISTKVDTPPISQDFSNIDHEFTNTTSSKNDVRNPIILPPCSHRTATTTAKLYAILEAVADRVEMHTNIGEQRNNWNSLLLSSINMTTLTATTMASLTAAGGAEQPVFALKLSSAILFAAAAGLMMVVNKLQPSQLVEEQRNATRLFKQLHEEIQTMLALRDHVTEIDVKYMMERVLALDKAYPLPLIGVMLEKFPEKLEPATWCPKNQFKQKSGDYDPEYSYMKEIIHVMKEKDKQEFIRLGNTALKLNKILSSLGPILTGMAAAGSAFWGCSSSLGILAVGGGALGTIVNSIEHGGQVGMVFEMYRNCAGFFQFMEESMETAVDDHELMEMKVCLRLGRTSSQLKDLATVSASSRKHGKIVDEFASKLL